MKSVKVWKSTLKTYQSDWARTKCSYLKGNKVKTRSSELNLSLPNQTYSCHNNWNWSTKSLSSPSNWFYPPLPFTLQFVFVKLLPTCII